MSNTIGRADKEKGSLSRKLVVLIVILIISIPSAFVGLFYYQVNSIQASFELLVEEENQMEALLPLIADLITGGYSGIIQYFLEGLEGKEKDITIRLSFTNPTFLYLNIKRVSTQLFIEDEYVFETTLQDLYIPSGKTIYKDVMLTAAKNEREIENFLELVSQAISSHGGEVKVSLSGNAKAQLLFFSIGIPFSIEQYHLMEEGFLSFDSARWTDSEGKPISTISKNDQVNIEVSVKNPTRKHTITGSVSVKVFRDVPLWFDEEMSSDTKSVTVSANSMKKIIFAYTPTISSTYHFDIFIDKSKAYTQPESERLRVTD